MLKLWRYAMQEKLSKNILNIRLLWHMATLNYLHFGIDSAAVCNNVVFLLLTPPLPISFLCCARCCSCLRYCAWPGQWRRGRQRRRRGWGGGDGGQDPLPKTSANKGDADAAKKKKERKCTTITSTHFWLVFRRRLQCKLAWGMHVDCCYFTQGPGYTWDIKNIQAIAHFQIKIPNLKKKKKSGRFLCCF